MDTRSHKPRTRIRRWFSWKHRRANTFHIGDLSDESDYEDDANELFINALEADRCVSVNELRIFVGTWNVAGRSPVGSLEVDLEEWLNPQDAADIYVLGFQEIVPLKTRTVIGAEDKTEANNWNVLIRTALNSTFGYPCLTPMLNPILSDSYCYTTAKSPSTDQQWTSISSYYGTPTRDCSIACTPGSQPSSSKYKLIASKKMVGVFMSVWMKKELLRKHRVTNVRICSVACGIMGYLGNKGSVSVSLLIEGTSLCFITAHLASGEKMGDEARRNHQVSQIFRRTFFLRHQQSTKEDSHLPLTILGHDQVFWFGDLNYRLCLEDNLARQLIVKQDWRALQAFDQLQTQLQDGGVFQGWKEGNIEFAPTYKYSSSNCNRYSGGFPRSSGEKRRTPAWCDRILWYGKGVKQVSYFRGESKFSDHRPVSALFSTRIEVVKPSANSTARVVPLPAAPVISPGIPIRQTEQNIDDEEPRSTLQSLLSMT